MSRIAPAGSFHPPSVAWTTVGLALAVFMQVLDGTIANVALPTIAGNLGVSSSQSAWVITSFAVSNAIALPLTGFLVRRVGQLRLFLWATALFTLASLLCGLAPSMGMLILFRALQGAVAGPMIPITQALMLSIYPPERRGFALSMIAMVTVVAPIAGPLLGGWITDSYSWRWAFLINIPVGMFACSLVANQMRGRPEVTERAKVDVVGLAALVIGVGALQIVLDRGNEADWFNSPLIVTLSIMAAIGLLFFLIWELTEARPIVDLRLFRHRNFAAGALALVCAYSAFYAVNVIMPMWLQRTLGYTPIWAGLAVAPMGVLPVLLTPFMGKYAPRFNLRLLVCGAFILLASASFLRAGFVVDIDFQCIALIQLLQGLGLALFIMPINAILLSDLKPEEIAAGSGLSTFLRTLGASLSVSITTLLWERRTTEHHARLGESLSAYDATTRQAISTLGHGNPAQGHELLNRLIDVQATQIAFNDVALVLGSAFLVAIALVWLAKPPFVPRAKA
ncbi:TPA: DHA2 family efflux MFS transporter permease subunit [Klebsiella pneumoniae]|jgi:DHA2 family multidrug resistance protein|uniref:DHA2 family efflux MFS transporter permease subunit n=1 Tax=Enterobacteriaceae TaxID=543 RepID=UPI0004DA1BAE|nr:MULTISPECIES: DHA2 family efflux MFS transporter permease subunit [Enterobacteriaceae]HBQ6197980.1 DHA2 family efflux MFS transporter permease subunit [Klebsiella variicola subsp. variicola]HBR1386719.1 DHA2 family efflux MFS transporter permease subunit [Klebsiella quasipneumoniae subsp. similipneumoniae]KEY49075.1 multidrug resistance protein B [Citrobacter amalonaticus]MBA6167673.1 DHA2 family efflux MFS transporter permease subunit [Klebsiella variicola]MBA6183367.1 DHA2 family efflux M